MKNKQHLVGDIKQIPTKRLAIVHSRFNEWVVKRLVAAACDVFNNHGVTAYDRIEVPGAFEIPMTAKKLIQQDRYAGILTLGAVIRGQTPHFDYVAGPCADALMRLSVDHALPVVFGVLTTDEFSQAVDRSGGVKGNKGADSALVLLEMCDLVTQIQKMD